MRIGEHNNSFWVALIKSVLSNRVMYYTASSILYACTICDVLYCIMNTQNSDVYIHSGAYHL